MFCPHCGEQGTLRKDGSRERHYGKQQRWACRSCGKTTANPAASKPAKEPAHKQFEGTLPPAGTYVFTAAQNATPPHKKFLQALKVFCNHNEAHLSVIPIRYKNPTSVWGQRQQDDDWWDPALTEYLFASRAEINENLVVLGDIRTQPTNIQPLTGFESITGAKSGILAHPKIQLKSVATPSHKLPKLMTTTGAVTVENYTDTAIGKRGEFHHSLGAVVVEIVGDLFFMRHLLALNNGTFIDKDKKYTPAGVEDAPPAAALIMGDSHIQFIDDGVVPATFEGPDSIVSVLRPKKLIWHDVFDNYAKNHHDKLNPFINLAKHKARMSSIPDELKLTCDFINKYGAGFENVIVPSNHNEGLERWIRETDWRADPTHMEFYLETALAMVRQTEMTPAGARTVDPFHYWAAQLLKVTNTLLKRDESYMVQGIELGMHGDLGPNGARGNIMNLRRIGVKSVIGHVHSPGIEEGCYAVGTNSRLRLQYNRGPSSWMHTDCVVYANGKRALYHIIDGRWKR